MDAYELGHAAPNSETRVKGFLFGGADFGWCLCAITYGRSRSYLLYLWSSWKGGSGAAGACGENAWAGARARWPPFTVLGA